MEIKYHFKARDGKRHSVAAAVPAFYEVPDVLSKMLALQKAYEATELFKREQAGEDAGDVPPHEIATRLRALTAGAEHVLDRVTAWQVDGAEADAPAMVEAARVDGLMCQHLSMFAWRLFGGNPSENLDTDTTVERATDETADDHGGD